VSYWGDLSHHEWDGLWMSHPAVRARINSRVTGDSGLWPIQWLASIVPDRVPFPRALSIGCGVGHLERSLAELGLVRTVTGIDESEKAIAEARRGAVGFEAIRYECAEARDFLSRQKGLDAIFFHASLHHFDRLTDLLGLVRAALAPNGILYCDEYVGPSRDEWRWPHLVRWNLIYRRLPRGVRRTHLVRPPINRDDPTEAVESSGIVPAIEKHFRVLARKDYGGNLLAVIYPNLRPRASSPELFDAAIAHLLDREDALLRREPGFHSVIVAQPSPAQVLDREAS